MTATRTVSCLVLFLAFLISRAPEIVIAQQVSLSTVYKMRDVSVPMRDGIILRADVWLPKPQGRFPTLIYRTPYGKQFAPEEWTTFEKAVDHGYAVVIEDVRGRYASDGEFVPYQNEGNDGYDTIEWAAAEPWSDGNVGTFGLSYPGAVQWLAAIQNPPHLKAMIPAMTFSTPRNFFYSGGSFDGSWIEWIWMNIAPDIRKRKNLSGAKTYEEARASWKVQRSRMRSFSAPARFARSEGRRPLLLRLARPSACRPLVELGGTAG